MAVKSTDSGKAEDSDYVVASAEHVPYDTSLEPYGPTGKLNSRYNL